MRNSFIKFLADFGPLLIFFVVYFKSGNNLKAAITPFIIATIIALAMVYLTEKKIPMIPLMSAILIIFFGGLTLYFGKYFTERPLLKIFFNNALNLQDEGWKKLNIRWVGFFIFVAALNAIVVETQSEVFWVNFKVWGLLPITLLFTASQIPLINKYKLQQ